VREAVALSARILDGPANALPLVVMHGLLGSSRNWQAHGKALARARPVFVLDLRNHGASPWSDVMDYPAMVADVLAFADRHGLERFHLLGHSMGGKVAMAVALTAAERVVGAVVADIAPVPYAHDFEELIGAMRGLDLEGIDRRAVADEALEPIIENAGVRHFALQNLDFDEAGRGYWKPNLAVLDASIRTLTGWPEAYDDLDLRRARPRDPRRGQPLRRCHRRGGVPSADAGRGVRDAGRGRALAACGAAPAVPRSGAGFPRRLTFATEHGLAPAARIRTHSFRL
jgi:esterase